MIQIDNIEVFGWQAAVRGMRNPMNSWDKSDSGWSFDLDMDMDSKRSIGYVNWEIGKADHELMMKLVKGGSVHAKFRRMITVTMDITAPLYWWKEAETYKVGTVCNSCSTMHKIHDKKFTLDDFSHEHLFDGIGNSEGDRDTEYYENPTTCLEYICAVLNHYRELFVRKPHRKDYWWQMIQLLPSSYNQRRTVQLNYEVLANIYKWRKDHKLDEWQEFCRIMKEQLPYSELFTGEEDG